MNNKTKQTKTSTAAENAGAGGCLCQGAGPLLSEFLRRIGPPPEARGHFESARVEFLKGLRAILDARIEQLSKTRGQKISVE